MMTDTINAPIGVLITNLGTPDAPTIPAVKKYLAEFLSDPYIVQIPKPLWWLILNGIILRTRPKKSAQLYKKIWTPSGSPLLVFSAELTGKMQVASLAKGLPLKFVLGMRYGQPSIKNALQTLKELKVAKIVILPLYPQFSTTTTASTFDEVNRQLKSLDWKPEIQCIDNYASEPSYIAALAQSIRDHWQKRTPGQKLIFSFHGIPKKHIVKGDPYYDQCLITANSVARQLNLDKSSWEIVFQSRFGREEWLQPYCIEVLAALPKTGCKHVDVICPGFAVDCLETLEEIAISNKEVFLQAGGSTYNYIPALNDSDSQIQSLIEILLTHLKQAE